MVKNIIMLKTFKTDMRNLGIIEFFKVIYCLDDISEQFFYSVIIIIIYQIYIKYGMLFSSDKFDNSNYFCLTYILILLSMKIIWKKK